jgi:hypothetical protein
MVPTGTAMRRFYTTAPWSSDSGGGPEKGGALGASLFHINQDGTLAVMRETAYDSEDLIQRLLEEHPEILAGDQFHGGEPRRWVLVSREMPVPDGKDGGNRWSLDHLFLDQDAVPTLVEVKRRSDTRSRREVIGQMFDYAANGPAYWDLGELRGAFEKTQREQSLEPDETLRVLTGDLVGPDQFWSDVERHLRAGRIRMVFVVDEVPPELLRIIEFLGRQLRDAEVYLVEVRQHVGQSGRVLATSVMGAGPQAAASAPRAPTMTEDQWIANFEANHGQQAGDIARGFMQWMKKAATQTFVTSSQNPSFGMMVFGGGRKNYPFFLVANGKISISLGYLASSVRFADESQRREIADRVQSATGFDFSGKNLMGDIRIPIQELALDTKRSALFGVLDWIVNELRNSETTI